MFRVVLPRLSAHLCKKERWALHCMVVRRTFLLWAIRIRITMAACEEIKPKFIAAGLLPGTSSRERHA